MIVGHIKLMISVLVVGTMTGAIAGANYAFIISHGDMGMYYLYAILALACLGLVLRNTFIVRTLQPMLVFFMAIYAYFWTDTGGDYIFTGIIYGLSAFAVYSLPMVNPFMQDLDRKEFFLWARAVAVFAVLGAVAGVTAAAITGMPLIGSAIILGLFLLLASIRYKIFRPKVVIVFRI